RWPSFVRISKPTAKQIKTNRHKATTSWWTNPWGTNFAIGARTASAPLIALNRSNKVTQSGSTTNKPPTNVIFTNSNNGFIEISRLILFCCSHSRLEIPKERIEDEDDDPRSRGFGVAGENEDDFMTYFSSSMSLSFQVLSK